ncbi:MAG: S8/S53 family peptidase [Oscillibacter sp.]|nr:S8/S53 family peptidase [Oscillibacter sp.]
MNKHGAVSSALCLLLALLTGCASPGTEALEAGTIRRHPAEAVSLWERNPEADHGFGDLRGADLRDMDLTDREEDLLSADFDTRTQWPESLPQGFDPQRLLELGKDPGLGLRALHEQGITGRGVGIAIIDQTLLAEHREYADRLRLYQEYHTAAREPASAHGPAAASIALGKTVGVAPEALLYFIADDLGTGEGADFLRDLSWYAEDVHRLIRLNETLPEGEKIRVISMSVGWMPEDRGAAELEAAIARAREAGIAVVCVNNRDPLLEPWMGMGRTPYGSPDDPEDCRPGAFWEELLYSGEFRGGDGSLLLVPMDRRTAASPAGEAEYAHFAEGGMSWAVPCVAGLYALACQVKPEVTFEEFLTAAQATARPLSVRQDGAEYPYGKAVDPAALLDALK